MIDLIKLISDPLLKDGIAIVAIVFTAIFVLIKHLLKFLVGISNKKEPDETRIEKHFRQTLEKYEKEKTAYLEDSRKAQLEIADKNNTITKLYIQIKVLKSRIRYLEFKLSEHNIKVSPQLDPFDD